MRLIYDKGALEFPLNNKTETFDLWNHIDHKTFKNGYYVRLVSEKV